MALNYKDWDVAFDGGWAMPGPARFATLNDGINEHYMNTVSQACLATLILVTVSMGNNKAAHNSPKSLTADYEIALTYEKAGEYAKAQTYFAAAAKDARDRSIALDGLLRVSKALTDEMHKQALKTIEVGALYAKSRMWEKSEASYANVASSKQSDIHWKATDGLTQTLDKQFAGHYYEERSIWVKRGFEVLAFIAATLVSLNYAVVLMRRRRTIEIQPFATPTEELSRQLAACIAYAQAHMRDPSALSVIKAPASTVVALPRFLSELPDLEDFEIASVTMPFTALTRIIGRPKLSLSGGLDAAPIANGYSIIRTRGQQKATVQNWPIRPGTERQDTLDFACNALSEAITVYAAP